MRVTFKEREQSVVGKRVRAVGMYYFGKGDLIVGEKCSTRRNRSNPNNENCIEMIDGVHAKAEVNREISAILSPLLEKLTSIDDSAHSKQNFAVKLVREVFKDKELKTQNVSGVTGRQSLDTSKLELVQKMFHCVHPEDSIAKQEATWNNCCKAINTHLKKYVK